MARGTDWDRVDIRAIHARYVAGESMTNLGREMGVSGDALRKAFRARGLSTDAQARQGKVSRRDVLAIHARYMAGESIDRISREMGTWPGAVRGMFRRARLTILPASRGQSRESRGEWTVTRPHACIEAGGVCLLCDRAVGEVSS